MTVKELRTYLNQLNSKFDDAEFAIIKHGEFDDVDTARTESRTVITKDGDIEKVDVVILETYSK